MIDDSGPLAGPRNDPIAATPVAWDRLVVPPGWEPVARLCRRLFDARAEITEAIMRRIREEIPMYRRDDPISDDQLRNVVEINLEMMLGGTAERTGPRAEHLAAARELGLRRGSEGIVPVNLLVQGFVVGYREIWDQLVEASRAEGEAAREELLASAATIWEWLHELTNALGMAYNDRAHRNAASTGAMRERFFEALLAGTADKDDLRGTAIALGFDPEAEFRALAIALSGTAVTAEAVAPQLSSSARRRHAVTRGSTVLALDQNVETEDVLGAIVQATGGAPVAVGTRRRGLTGAALSLTDAERTLPLAERAGGVVDFDHQWHAATVLASGHRLSDVLAKGIERARQSPDLAATVIAYADNGFSKSAAAKALHLHPNTVAYRLARWAQLTGWNPEQREGLLKTLAALELAENV